MKYKVDDKVKIIQSDNWSPYTLETFEKLSNRTVTITKAWLNEDNVSRYEFKEISHVWGDYEIECLVEHIPEEIDRFILMDFD